MPEVSAPASSGNLGPGFDTIALALELRCAVKAAPADVWSASHVGVHVPGEDDTDVVLAVARRVVGESRPLALVVDNSIPLSRGLGSSSAALAAGAAAAQLAVDGHLDADAVFELVAEWEGHGDNAAATVYGGLMGVGADGAPVAIPIHDRWRIVVAVPSYELATTEARSFLSPSVDRQAVVRNLGRFATLLQGLRVGDPDLLARAGGDELHERPRAALHPAADRLMVAAREAGAAHAAWSGAGPSVLAVCDEASLPAVEQALAQTLAAGGQIVRLEVASRGLVVMS